MTYSEEQIKKAVVDRISSDVTVDASDIGVHVSDGNVVLCGTVPSDLAREIAADDALGVTGVKTVDNRLEIQPPPSKMAPTDEELVGQIQAALSALPNTRRGQFQVTVDNRVATLAGSVDALWLKVHGERIVSEVAGVSAVRNHVEVVPSEPVPDAVIATAILDALKGSESIDDETVNVRVEQGIVTLSGSVSSNSASQIACNDAINSVGVRDLRNNLEVKAS
jgi:osmotically-inducible protein OsmY